MIPFAAAGDAGPMLVAIVYAVDGVRFTAAARSAAALQSELVRYVRQQAPARLWPHDAARVDQLLSDAALEAAIDLYFASVGSRWDEERLHIEGIAPAS
jgi:beta-lactamase class A